MRIYEVRGHDIKKYEIKRYEKNIRKIKHE
jgi:hypothetical protein